MDSITLIALIGAIEEQFNFEFDDEDLNMEKFKSIKKIIKYVEEKTL
jgi:acyl carrier protein